MTNSILFQSLTASQQTAFNQNLETYFPNTDFTILFELFENNTNTSIESLNETQKELLLDYTTI